MTDDAFALRGPETPRWAALAACRNIDDPDLFFPGRRDSPAAALAVCIVCPVRIDCARHALDTPEPFGVWGGLTEQERGAHQHGGRASPDSRASSWVHRPARRRGA